MRLSRKVTVAKVIDAWGFCEERREETNRQEAISRARNEPNTHLMSEHISLRARYEVTTGKLDTSEYPTFFFIPRQTVSRT